MIQKVARLCWNNNYWIKPSGKIGKSTNKSFESLTGFGYEEWLFDLSKLVDGYHYGFIQGIHNGIARGWKGYVGATFDIFLYTLNSDSGQKYWIGKINNVKSITSDDAQKAIDNYSKNGWLEQMKNQLREVGVSSDSLQTESLFCIKYLPEDLDLYDNPILISEEDITIRTPRYILFNKKGDPILKDPLKERFSFKPGEKSKILETSASYHKSVDEIDFLHNKISKNIYQKFVEIFGKNNVSTEQPTGNGTAIDICIKFPSEYWFFEIKTYPSAKKSIREAIGQLLEYSYFPNRNLASKLIVISPAMATQEVRQYISNIRETFKIPIYYRRYNLENDELDEEI